MRNIRPVQPPALWNGPEIRNLDVLRASAVSCVFLAHLLLFLIYQKLLAFPHPEIADLVLNEMGHVGVLFFFVHTALVLLLSLDRTPKHHSTANFYLRRACRIYPLSIVCVVIVLLIQAPQVPEGRFLPFDWLEILSNIFLVQNLTGKADVITTLWTLAREVQMYVALPVLYWLVRRFPSPIVCLILWIAFSAATPYTLFFMWFPCFMGGVFAYQLSRQPVFRVPAWLWPLLIAALLSAHILLSVTLLPDTRNDYILCMVLGALIPNVADLKSSWLTAAAQTVAKYSYGVYLFHFPIIWLAFVKLKSAPLPLRFAALLFLMGLIPWLGYRWIEEPCIEIGRRWAARLSREQPAVPIKGPYPEFERS